MAFINIPNLFGPINNPIQDFINNWSSNWGIFDSTGQPLTGFGLSLIGATQSFYSLYYNKQTVVSNFPVEQGGFATYNKVLMPAMPMVTLNLTGNENDRTQFLNTIDNACQSTELFTIITPEIQYVNFTIEGYSYSRSAYHGTTLLSVILILEEVLQVQIDTGQGSTVAINNPANAGDSSSQSGGKIQPGTPSNAVQNIIINGT